LQYFHSAASSSSNASTSFLKWPKCTNRRISGFQNSWRLFTEE
jgi:hypothetical protein